jgi:hypothetical protein
MLRIDWHNFFKHHIIFGLYLEMYYEGKIILGDAGAHGNVETRMKYKIKKYPTWVGDVRCPLPWHGCKRR